MKRALIILTGFLVVFLALVYVPLPGLPSPRANQAAAQRLEAGGAPEPAC